MSIVASVKKGVLEHPKLPLDPPVLRLATCESKNSMVLRQGMAHDETKKGVLEHPKLPLDPPVLRLATCESKNSMVLRQGMAHDETKATACMLA